MAAGNPTNYSNEASITPPQGSFVITPSDSADLSYDSLPILVRGLFIEAAATIKVTWENGMVDTLPLAAGGHNMRVKRVWATPPPGTVIHGLV
jgi:hypothetical protein